MRNARRLFSTLAGTAIIGGTLVTTAAPAHAVCYVDIINAGYGASDYCSDYANGVAVQVGRGIAQVTIYCGGVLWYNRLQGTGPVVVYRLASSGCSAEVSLTARADGRTDAVAYVD